MSARDRDFADWADLRGDRMVVKLWGRVCKRSGWRTPSDMKGKGKVNADEEPSWQELRSWDVSLNDMVLLPDNVRCQQLFLT